MTSLKFGNPKQELYRKKDIQAKYGVSIGTINNRITDKTFTKIIPIGSRLVYIKCKEVDAYFKGESTTNTKTFSRSVTSESRKLVKLLPRVQREPIEKLLKRIEDIEKSVGVDSIAEEIGIKKKRKSVRKKAKSVSTYYPKTSNRTSKRYNKGLNNYSNDTRPRGGGKGGLSLSDNKSSKNTSKGVKKTKNNCKGRNSEYRNNQTKKGGNF